MFGELKSQFVIGDQIAHGSAASKGVYEGFEKAQGRKVAIKVLDKVKIEESLSLKEKVVKEAKALKLVSHSNIIKLFDVIETPEHIFLVMELVQEGNLWDYVAKHGPMTDGQALNCISQILRGIRYLHRKKIVHRDLKPENILIKGGNKILITDFGLCSFIDDGSYMTTQSGTPYCVAPEVFAGIPYKKSIDLWALGVITYFVLYSFPPFRGDDLQSIADVVQKCEYTFPSTIQISDASKDFISKLLNPNPDLRLTAEEAFEHPWITSNNSFSNE